jgi:hypothetical protein
MPNPTRRQTPMTHPSPLQQPVLPLRCQRWRHPRDSYRPAREVINPGRHMVPVLDDSAARQFCEENHHSQAYVASRFRVGLFRKAPDQPDHLAGVAVFSPPMNQQAITTYSGLPPTAGTELGRLVLLDEVEGNGEKSNTASLSCCKAAQQPRCWIWTCRLGILRLRRDPLPAFA